MAQPNLSEALLRETARLVSEHGSISGAARAANLSRQTLQHRYERLAQLGPSFGIEVPALDSRFAVARPNLPPPTPKPTIAERQPLAETADGYWAALDSAIGRTPKALTRPVTAKARLQQGVERIVIAGDFHAPFHEPELVARVVAEGATSDVLIVNGDLQDFYSISRFTKYERVSIEQEFAAVDAILGTLSQAFREVVIVCGNHDKPRFERQIRACVSIEMLDVIAFLTGGTFDPIAMLAKRYPNVTLARHDVGRHQIGWFYQRGDLLCAHAEKFSRVPGTALRSIHEWFTERQDTLGLAPWRVLVQAHTHQLGLIPWMNDALLIEGGCMCQTHGYQLDARIAGRPQRRGYAVLEQVHGVTDLNSVRLVWWDAARRGGDGVSTARGRSGYRDHGAGAVR